MQSDQCPNCKHYLMGLACEAFPEGIPFEILSGEFDHAEPYKGDNGIRYTPMNGEKSRGDIEDRRRVVSEDYPALKAEYGREAAFDKLAEQFLVSRWTIEKDWEQRNK